MDPSKHQFKLPATFRDRGHRIFTLCTWGVCAVAIGWTLVDGRGPVLLLTLGFATVAYLTWWLMWQPYVKVGAEEVTIANPLRVTVYPMAGIERVDTQYHFAVVVDGTRRYAWALPAPSFLETARLGLSDSDKSAPTATKDTVSDNTVRLGDLSSNDCGAAAGVLRSVLARFTPDNSTPDITQRTLAPQCGVAVALVISTVVSAFI